MRTRLVLLLFTCCVLGFAMWFVQSPAATHADEIPEKYRDTVHRGLEYLIKHQHEEGHWDGDDGKYPVAMTGLVGIALLMEKDNPKNQGIRFQGAEAKYLANICKAVDWLLSKSRAQRDGLIYSDHASETSRYMQGHGLATMFLAGALKLERDEARRRKLTDVLTRAVKYIGKAQSTQGGWHDTSKMEGHDFATLAATIIQVQALQAAENASIPIPIDCIGDAREYVKAALVKLDAKKEKEKDPGRQADTAGALASAFRPSESWGGEKTKENNHETWLKYCQAEIPMGRDIKFGRDELTHFYYAQVAFESGWESYRTPVFDHVQANQNKDGSWPRAEGLGVGQVYATALWCAVLQMDRRSHPARARDIPVLITTRRFERSPDSSLGLKGRFCQPRPKAWSPWTIGVI